MFIRKKRIRSLSSNVRGFQDGHEIYIALDDISSHRNPLVECGFTSFLEAGETVLPQPKGTVSTFNAEGVYKPDKTKPKETAYRQAEWNWKEFRGRYDSIERSKIVDIPYKRYPRIYTPPPSVELTISTNSSGENLVCSPAFTFGQENEADIVHVINLFLELFGECRVLDSELNPPIRAPIKRLNWEVLPQGKMPWARLQEKLTPVINKQPEGNQPVINARFKAINDNEPEFVAVGQGGFQGYVIFGFPEKNIFVLESTQTNNATYVLGQDWENIADLPKAEILQDGLHQDRIIHREGWFAQLTRLLQAP